MIWSFDIPQGMVGWFLTFAIHGTTLLTVAWVLCHVIGRRLPDPVRETVWKAAVVVPLLTASLQILWVPEPVAGHLARLEVGSAAPIADLPEPNAQPPGTLELEPGNAIVLRPASSPGTEAQQHIPMSSTPRWDQAGLLATLALAACAAALRVRAGRHLRSALRTRVPVIEGELRAILDRLCVRAGYGRRVRLSLSPELGTPIAFGLFRPEICLPTKVAARLSEQQRHAVLGHELGHLARRDPLWLFGFGMLTVLFAWQPLLRVARREYQKLAEYRCDAFAADLAGHLPVARCLLEVAELVTRPWRRMSSSAMAMAAPASMLKRRVDRLLQRARPHRTGIHRWWLIPAVPGAIIAMTLAAPGVDVTVERALVSAHPGAGPSPSAVSGGTLLDQLDTQWALLQAEVAALDAVVAELPADDEIRHLRNLVVEQLRVIATRRERIQQLITNPASRPAAEASQEGGSR